MALVVKNPPASAGEVKVTGSIPGSGRSPRGECEPTPAFLPGEVHGQRRLGLQFIGLHTAGPD